MKLLFVVAAVFSAAHAWKFNVSEVTPPDEIVGEHQPLQRVWTISSLAQLEQLYLAVPGPVFVDLDPSILPPQETSPSEIPGVIPGKTPGVEPGETPGVVPGVVPGMVPESSPEGSLSGSDYDWSDISEANAAIEIPSMTMHKFRHQKHHRYDDEDDRESRNNGDDENNEEHIVAKIVVTGNSTDLLNMMEAVPLHPHRNDGLKLHLKNQDAFGQGFVLTHVFLFNRNLLRSVTTAFSGDVVLKDDVWTVDDENADTNLACVGEGNLYIQSTSNVTLRSLEVEVTGSGRVQLDVPSVTLTSNLDVEVAGSGVVALVADDVTAEKVKVTVSGAGDVVFDTSVLSAQKLEASVYGSGVASFAASGFVDKETLTVSGPGHLFAGSIIARKAGVHVWGNGELLVQVTDKLIVSTSVWGKVGYINALPTVVKIKGWWFWRDVSSIVYPAAVNKVLIYEPATLPADYPVFYAVKTFVSPLADPDYAMESVDLSDFVTSLSSEQPAASTQSYDYYYMFIGVGIVALNVVAAHSWSQRRGRRHYLRLP